MRVFTSIVIALIASNALAQTSQPRPSTRQSPQTSVEVDLRRIVADLQKQIADLKKENQSLHETNNVLLDQINRLTPPAVHITHDSLRDPDVADDIKVGMTRQEVDLIMRNNAPRERSDSSGISVLTYEMRSGGIVFPSYGGVGDFPQSNVVGNDLIGTVTVELKDGKVSNVVKYKSPKR